jgi:hypothetical protein
MMNLEKIVVAASHAALATGAMRWRNYTQNIVCLTLKFKPFLYDFHSSP